ncbi:MAG: hypothetical protein LBS06_07435 [Treponema sp.]|jgi:hypothetical protein|nr:hypothetical protein [Treponema sp.]
MAGKPVGPDEFWADYEKKTGDKVLAFCLGQYISGWDEFNRPLWGLLIATEGGFRFHHFPHEGWLQALARIGTGGEVPKEKTLFLPGERIVSAELRIEKSWWRRLFAARPPLFVLQYLREDGGRTELVIEAEKKAQTLVDCFTALSAAAFPPDTPTP